MEVPIRDVGVLLPVKFWDRVGKIPKPESRDARDATVLVGWMFPRVAKHWLVTSIEHGMYFGVNVDRVNKQIGDFAGLLGDPYALMSLASQGVQVDKSCGVCQYTVEQVFDRMDWNKGMLR